MQAANPRRGYILGLSAYIIWGLFPIYFKAIAEVPAVEIIIHRVLWSALFGALLLMVWKHPGWLRELLDNPKRLAILALSGTLIAANWLTYVWSVNNGRMLEASLGYYINPLVNVLLGMLILGERLRRMQWLAVGLAAVGVAQDLDDCRMGPAVQDIWMMLAGDRQECMGQLSELMDGYNEFHDFDPRELALIEPLRALRLMHYSAWLARRWDDPAFPHSFPWFGTERYWGDQVLALREQLSALNEEPLKLF